MKDGIPSLGWPDGERMVTSFQDRQTLAEKRRSDSSPWGWEEEWLMR